MRWQLAAAALAVPALFAGKPFHSAQLIFEPEHWHNHSSCVVELPGGDLFACWYNGSGERTADDVKIQGARLRKGSKRWSARITLADTPGFPDTNPAMFIDARKRLWLIWPAIIANEWHTALLRYRISSDYSRDEPVWTVNETLLFKPRNFAAKVKQEVERLMRAEPQGPAAQYGKEVMDRAADKYFSRMGWMPRAHPVQLPSGRILVPLYSDGYSFSLVAISDDGGLTWESSEPIVGAGAVQPSLARKRDGTLVAYMRDNGPPPKRVHLSESKDDGVTWSAVVDSDIPNPGSGMETIVLADGTWAMILNDSERGRHSLAVWLSDDEGKTWNWKRHLESDNSERPGSYHYPSLIQARDGTLHATYSHFAAAPAGAPARKSIKHAHFNVDWVKQGHRR